MEVIAAATTVCALCRSIEQWIDQLSQREELFLQISCSVSQIHRILVPFSASTFRGTGEIELSQSILCVGDALQRTKEHLAVWKYKRSQKIIAFINPGVHIQKLKEDQKHISNQLIILLTSIAAVGYFRDHAREAESQLMSLHVAPTTPDVPGTDGIQLALTDELKDGDTKIFWRDFIGLKVNFVTTDLFTSRLQSWYEDLNDTKCLTRNTCDRMIMRLDEFNCGGITPYNLEHALEGGTLKQFVDRYIKGAKPSLNKTAMMMTVPNRELRTPLLVWIDDRPGNNEYETSLARSLGIMTVELYSTAIAKAWVEANLEFLRNNDNPSYLRFISDNVRLETTFKEGTFLNQTAGHNFLQYLRARFFEAPVLIYTGGSIDTTLYVESFSCAGSTTDSDICLQYIESLGEGKSEDNSWKGFKRGTL